MYRDIRGNKIYIFRVKSDLNQSNYLIELFDFFNLSTVNGYFRKIGNKCDK